MYIREEQDMCEGSKTVVRCAVGLTEGFKVEVGLHQGSTLSPLLLAIVMGRMTDEIRHESPWTMIFVDDTIICSERRRHMEKNLEMCKNVLEKRGIKVSRIKTEYMCIKGGLIEYR